MRALVRSVLNRLPYIGSIRQQLARQGAYPAGHYYSPIPAAEDVSAYLDTTDTTATGYVDVELQRERQRELLETFSGFYAELPFRDKPTERCRYSFDQTTFCHADAIVLYSFLRHIQPKRIVEVGSGYSSAVMLDTIDAFFPHPVALTCIEPYPDRLRSLLRPGDTKTVTLIDRPVQQVPLETFLQLGPGDLLFIDSSHVVKAGNDVQYLLFEVVPRLQPGVFVHFHDICRGFEYPPEWLRAGMYWNEMYLVRAFLAFNSDWEVYFFNNYVGVEFADFLRQKMPLYLKDIGGSLYLRRRQRRDAGGNGNRELAGR